MPFRDALHDAAVGIFPLVCLTSAPASCLFDGKASSIKTCAARLRPLRALIRRSCGGCSQFAPDLALKRVSFFFSARQRRRCGAALGNQFFLGRIPVVDLDRFQYHRPITPSSVSTRCVCLMRPGSPITFACAAVTSRAATRGANRFEGSVCKLERSSKHSQKKPVMFNVVGVDVLTPPPFAPFNYSEQQGRVTAWGHVTHVKFRQVASFSQRGTTKGQRST